MTYTKNNKGKNGEKDISFVSQFTEQTLDTKDEHHKGTEKMFLRPLVIGFVVCFVQEDPLNGPPL